MFEGWFIIVVVFVYVKEDAAARVQTAVFAVFSQHSAPCSPVLFYLEFVRQMKRVSFLAVTVGRLPLRVSQSLNFTFKRLADLTAALKTEPFLKTLEKTT